MYVIKFDLDNTVPRMCLYLPDGSAEVNGLYLRGVYPLHVITPPLHRLLLTPRPLPTTFSLSD